MTTSSRCLMVVSQSADAGFRAAVSAGERPTPEFLELERLGAVEVFDWSRLGHSGRRSAGLSLRHARQALRRVDAFGRILSDGEHVGIPIALALQAAGRRPPHAMIGHRLTTWKKRPFMSWMKSWRGIDRIVIHSRRQGLELVDKLRVPADRIRFVPYAADTNFWRPREQLVEPRLVVAAGREQRDYATLVHACDGLDVRLVVALDSPHSPAARCRLPEHIPEWATFASFTHAALRDLYARASLVVVPLLQNDFQAGVTTLLEAMAMGRPTIVSATHGQADVARPGSTAITVPPEEVEPMREAIRTLLADPKLSRRIGDDARSAVEEGFSLGAYVGRLAGLLEELN